MLFVVAAVMVEPKNKNLLWRVDILAVVLFKRFTNLSFQKYT